jgi:raffinose/stachyose/melibiose transport system substrate-binding protein
MKKSMALLLALLLTFMLAACTGKTTTDKTPSTTQETTTATTEQKDTATTEQTDTKKEDVVISVLTHFESSTYGPIYETAWEQIEEMRGYTLDIDMVSTDVFKTKMKVYLAGGDIPNIMSFAGGAQSDPFIEKGLLAPAEDYIAKSEHEFNKAFLATKADGHIYGIPATVGNSMFLCYNKSILKDIGMEPPQTIEEFQALIKALKGKDIAAIGTGLSNKWLGDFIYMAMVARAEPQAYSKAVKGEITWDSEPFLNAAKKIVELVDMGAFNEDLISIDVPTADTMFEAGKYATMLEGGWRWGRFYESMGDNLGYAPFPNFFNDPNYTKTALVNPSMINTVASAAKFKDEAFDVCLLYSHLVSEDMAQNGKITLTKTDTKPTSEVYEDYQKLKADLEGLTTVVPSWSDYLQTSDLEKVKDLSQQLYGKVITPEDFVKQYAAVLSQSGLK